MKPYNDHIQLNTLQEEHNLQTERKTVELNSHTASPRMVNYLFIKSTHHIN
jgi:hypothetical protein